MIRRSRTIKPELFSSADVRALTVAERWTFVGLLFYVDDYGNESADAALVKAAIWPTDNRVTVAVVESHLVKLAERDMVTFYEVDGRRYLRVTNWDKHQRVDRPSRSNIPPDPTRERLLATEGGVGGGSRREGDDEELGEYEGERAEGREGGEGARSRVLSDVPPSPFCGDHPNGTTKPCKACGNARLSLKAWENARDSS